jgi:dipeptidyl aminopeptidase/acylaminoacyl peptidase
MEQTTASYGSWRSPVTAELLAAASVHLGFLLTAGQDVYWVEGRPLENGRNVVVKRTPDGQIADVTPVDFNARTLVHEYGGGAYVVQGDTVYFSHFADQRLYRQAAGTTPVPITPEPATPRGWRYADGRVTPDGRWLICVRERHEEGRATGTPSADAVAEEQAVSNELVALALDGSDAMHVIASGYDFYSNPRLSPDGRKLAWLCWQNPQMPWDGSEVWVADFGTDATLHNARRVAGSATESLFQPEWSPDGVLHFVSDRSNWWNLYREVEGRIEAVAPLDAEFGQPQWVFGQSRYTFLPDGRIACIYSQHGLDYLGLIRPGSQRLEPVPCAYTALHWIANDGERLWLIGGSPTSGATILVLDLATAAVSVIRHGLRVEVDAAFFAAPQPLEFPTDNSQTAHALFYPPHHPHYVAPAGELPPLLVMCHGGPTSATLAQLSLGVQYWTSRGFGVVDVNYGGSSGYGREYRQRLNGNWGVVDVMDCINAARALIAQDQADPRRVAIRGGSAGGYTTLRALTWQNFFAAGANYFGLAELEVFVDDTHKFEARYLETLVGPYPARQDLYYERSPVHFVDNLNVPVIVFQGLEDKIVPPSQSEIIVAALKQKGVPHAYLAFEGEQHGFRKAESIRRCAEAELYFYGYVFGFTPADTIEPVPIEPA